MGQFLVLSLYAPLQSWGAIAMGGDRATWRFPSRSALVGLMAAAQGITRDNEGLLLLHRKLRIAVRADASAPLIRSDFHTAQVPPAKRNKRWDSRAHELADGDLLTVLSEREYLHDAAFTVAVWSVDDEFDLTAIAEALKSPQLVLYLGRKSCPIGLPLKPEIVSARTAKDALDGRVPPRSFLRWVVRDKGELVDACADNDPMAGIQARAISYRRDVLSDILQWQFIEREEILGSLEMP